MQKASSACWLPSRCDSTAGSTVPLFCSFQFVCNQKGGGHRRRWRRWGEGRGGKTVPAARGLEYGNLAGLGGLDLGERLGGEQGVPVEPGVGWGGGWVWDWVWADLLCNVNPWGIRSCNRRGEVAARSLGMLTLRIPPPWYTAIRKLHWRAPARGGWEEGGGCRGGGATRVKGEGQEKREKKKTEEKQGWGQQKAKINDRSHWWKSCAIF